MINNGSYGIVEVFYDKVGPVSWTQHTYPTGDTVDELKADLEMMNVAFTRDEFVPPVSMAE